jgi:hypothetical protein
MEGGIWPPSDIACGMVAIVSVGGVIVRVIVGGSVHVGGYVNVGGGVRVGGV